MGQPVVLSLVNSERVSNLEKFWPVIDEIIHLKKTEAIFHWRLCSIRLPYWLAEIIHFQYFEVVFPCRLSSLRHLDIIVWSPKQSCQFCPLVPQETFEPVLGVHVPYKRDRSLIKWDRSHNINYWTIKWRKSYSYLILLKL